ncbi:MAG TPA: 16S rRNA (cytosine(1402)-N(4))-methyltransferase RsmH [Candidatus Methylacidiphilales bacterium]|nr:16S rRNA (cytosine(1402)-N(4))-methyltransferase RsmH [Candidatus Methylacidiphilales bacterium]
MKREDAGGHVPVLLAEVLAAAQVKPGDRWIDGTFGRGGHTRALLERGAAVLGLDQDGEAAEAARALEDRWPGDFKWKQRNFKDLKTCTTEHGWAKVDGVLLDLGVSSPQLERAERGFSFQAEGPLDMRMDQRGGPTAADLVNRLPEEELSKLFYEHGGEREARRVARAVATRRRTAPFRTTTDLAMVVAKALPRRGSRGLHPATKVFQALRIAVNREKEALVAALPQAVEIMKPGGILAVISFHSGEDRVVKQFMRERSAEWMDTPGRPNTLPNPQRHLREVRRFLPSEGEVAKNPRARSARLRTAIRNEEKIAV